MDTYCGCHKCGAPWENAALKLSTRSPGICKACGERSAKIVLEKKG